MEQQHSELDCVVPLTQKLIHSFFNNELELWFSYLHPHCTWIATGAPSLIGAKAIKLYFTQVHQKEPSRILQEDYTPIQLGPRAAQVVGRLLITPLDKPYKAEVLLTMTYRLVHHELKLISHHFSYEFIQAPASPAGTLELDLNTQQFVRLLLLERKHWERIPIPCISHTSYVDPDTILYIQTGEKNRSELICIDKVIVSTATLHELTSMLPATFYPLHRSYLVNTRYITSLRRYEVELLSGMTLPVPPRNYMQVKTYLNEHLNICPALKKKKEKTEEGQS